MMEYFFVWGVIAGAIAMIPGILTAVAINSVTGWRWVYWLIPLFTILWIIIGGLYVKFFTLFA